jgi:hypothetical protein
MNSYRRNSIDDSLVFSMDFANKKFEDNYRIESEREGFILNSDKRKVCGEESGAGLAVSVWTNDTQDFVVVLRVDGNRRSTKH